MLMKSAVVICDSQSSELVDGANSPPKSLDCNGRSVNANKSVHYHQCINGDSCHGRVEPVTISDLGVTSANANESVHYNHFNDGDSCHGHVERSLCPLFTITILMMERAATIVLNGLFVLPRGFMYSRSPLGRHLLGRRLPPLHTSSYQCIKRKYGIVATGARRRNCASSKICLRRL